jgi:hypothetical protein
MGSRGSHTNFIRIGQNSLPIKFPIIWLIGKSIWQWNSPFRWIRSVTSLESKNQGATYTLQTSLQPSMIVPFDLLWIWSSLKPFQGVRFVIWFFILFLLCLNHLNLIFLFLLCLVFLFFLLLLFLFGCRTLYLFKLLCGWGNKYRNLLWMNDDRLRLRWSVKQYNLIIDVMVTFFWF